MTAPLETEREARELPAVQAVYRAFDADPGAGKMAPHTRQMLEVACAAAGVDLGAFDRRVIVWLSGWEPETAAVVVGLITRAHESGQVRNAPAGQLSALADSIDQRLDDEDANRQTIAEDIAAQLRALAGGAR